MEELKYDNGITLFVDEDKVLYAWINNGTLSVKSLLQNEGVPQTPEGFVEYLKREVIEKGKVVCSDCGKIIEEVAGRHFAGVYCPECWEKFKSKNSSICSLCGRPYYECSC